MNNENIQVYNKLIDFLDANIETNKNICFGVVYNHFRLDLISEADFIYIMTHYFIND